MVLVWTAAALIATPFLAGAALFYRRKAARLAAQVEEMQRESRVRECIERQLEASQSNLHMATEASGLGTWYWDLHTDQVTCSPQALRLFGLENTGNVVSSSECIDAVHPDDVQRVRQTIAAAVEAGEIYQVDYRVTYPNGRTVWLLTSGRALRDGDGKVRRIAGISNDITDRKRLEENFHQAQKMEAVGRLAGGIAHDFNNMLGVISAYAELLQEDPGLPASSTKRVTEILTAVQRANALTRQLLAFSRKQVINPTSLDLNAVLLGVKDMVQRLLGEDVRLTLNLSRDLPAIRADRGQLEQVLLNFAANSRDAMPKGGSFELRTAANAGMVTLDVSDSGSGMSAAVMKHIFEPFFTTKDAGRGTGLGLATVYGVIEQAQGKITVDSAVGAGTTFHLEFPALAAFVQPTDTPAQIPEPATSATVMVVEDESALRDVLIEFLQVSGFRVIAAGGGREALARMDLGETVDVLLTDLVMSGMDGRSLAHAARAKLPNLQVIHMSGHTDDTLIQKQLLHEGLVYLQKPFSRADLVKAINAVLLPVA